MTDQGTGLPLFLSPEAENSSYASRMLGNLLLHTPGCPEAGQDPEYDFLAECSGFGLFSCAVSCVGDTSRSMQQLVLQQETAYQDLKDALAVAGGPLLCVTTELENQLVAMFLRHDGAALSQEEFQGYLSRLIEPALKRLSRSIPLYAVFGVQPQLGRLGQSYVQMKNAIVLLDYMQSPRGQLVQVGTLEPKAHIGLWKQMETSNAAFVAAFLQGDVDAAIACVNRIIDDITDWIPPSKDNLLADIQYYFDAVMNRLSAQFGAEVLQGISINDAIFESVSLLQLRDKLSDIVRQLFLSMRKNTSSDTFNRLLEVRIYIHDNIRQYELSAGSVAAHFSISPQLLSMQFKQCFGITPLQYIEQQRVALVQEYLVKTKLPMERICELTGIGTVSTLHRIFQKHCGQSPGLYRRVQRQSAP